MVLLLPLSVRLESHRQQLKDYGKNFLHRVCRGQQDFWTLSLNIFLRLMPWFELLYYFIEFKLTAFRLDIFGHPTLEYNSYNGIRQFGTKFWSLVHCVRIHNTIFVQTTNTISLWMLANNKNVSSKSRFSFNKNYNQ